MIMEKEDTHSLCTNNTKCEDNPFPVDSKSDLRKPATHPAPQARFSSRVLHNLEDNGAIEIEASSTRNRKKCYNTKCGNSGSLRKVKSRVEKSRYRYFCEACFLLYKGLQFCEFCEQIYGSGADEEEDLENWVGCDTCDRWVLLLLFRTTFLVRRLREASTPTPSGTWTTSTPVWDA